VILFMRTTGVFPINSVADWTIDAGRAGLLCVEVILGVDWR
jgi:hypothetical protein